MVLDHDIDRFILVALAHDTSVSLCEFIRSPRGIEVMDRDRSVLDIHSSTHLARGTNQDIHRAGFDALKQPMAICVRLGLVNKADCGLRHTQAD